MVPVDSFGGHHSYPAMSGRRSGKKPHHADPRYTRASAAIRQTASLNPRAVCWRCGKTLDQHTTRTGKPDRWQAGHTIDGSTTWQPWYDVTAVPPAGDWLAPEARSCNAAAGAHRRNTMSASGYDWP